MPLRVFLRVLLVTLPFSMVLVGLQTPAFHHGWKVGAACVVIGIPALIALTPRDWRASVFGVACAFAGLGVLARVLESALRYWLGETTGFALESYAPLWLVIVWGAALFSSVYIFRSKASRA